MTYVPPNDELIYPTLHLVASSKAPGSTSGGMPSMMYDEGVVTADGYPGATDDAGGSTKEGSLERKRASLVKRLE